MFFSIIVPVYNTSKFLRQCLDSIANQIFNDYEIIIVNDGSTDGSLKIINDYLDVFNQLTVINQENRGLASARNSGLHKAMGEYIIHIDSDDWVESNYLFEIYDKLLSDDFDMLICDYYVNQASGRQIFRPDAVFIQNHISGHEYIEHFLKGEITPSIWSKVCKRSLYLDNEIEFPSGISMGEDLATSPLLGYNANKIGKLDCAYVHYVQHDSAMTKSFNAKALKDLNFALLRLSEYFKGSSMDDLLHSFTVRQLTDSFFSSKKIVGCDKELNKYLRLIKVSATYYNPTLSKKIYFKVLLAFPYKCTINFLYYFNKVIGRFLRCISK